MGLIAPTGLAYLADSDGSLYVSSNLRSNGATIAGSYVGYAAEESVFANGKTKTSGMFGGTGQERQFANLSYTAEGNDRGTFNINYERTVADIGANLPRLQGTWDSDDGSVTTIAADGSFASTESDGCRDTGRFFVLDPSRNVYSVSGTSRCSEIGAASFSGLATFLPAGNGSPDAVLTLGVGSNDVAGFGYIERR